MVGILLRPRVLSRPLNIILRHGHLSRVLLTTLATLATRAGHRPDNLAEVVNFLEDSPAHVADVVHDLKVEVECCRAVGLVGGVVPDLQVWVLERLLHTDAAGGIKC